MQGTHETASRKPKSVRQSKQRWMFVTFYLLIFRKSVFSSSLCSYLCLSATQFHSIWLNIFWCILMCRPKILLSTKCGSSKQPKILNQRIIKCHTYVFACRCKSNFFFQIHAATPSQSVLISLPKNPIYLERENRSEGREIERRTHELC